METISNIYVNYFFLKSFSTQETTVGPYFYKVEDFSDKISSTELESNVCIRKIRI